MEPNDDRTDKNWNNLPVELKVECIKQMDFKTRWALRSTSSVEKELVEGTKCSGEHLCCVTGQDRLCVLSTPRNFTYLPFEAKAVEAAFKMGCFFSWQITNKKCLEIIHGVSQNIRFDVKELNLRIRSAEYLSIVDKCRGLSSLVINFVPGRYHAAVIEFSHLSATCESVYEVNDIFLSGFISVKPDDVIQLIDRWIAVDKKEDSKFQVVFRAEHSRLELIDNLKKTLEGNREIVGEYARGSTKGFYIRFGEKYMLVAISNDELIVQVTDIMWNANRYDSEEDESSDESDSGHHFYGDEAWVLGPDNYDYDDFDFDFNDF